MKKILLLMILCAFLSGCLAKVLPESEWECKRLEAMGMKEEYRFSFAKSEKTGELIIECVPPSRQMFIKNYKIQIDNDEIKVFKYSVTVITLDAGTHLVKISAPGFGLDSRKKICIEENEQKNLFYEGPYWIFSAGLLR